MPPSVRGGSLGSPEGLVGGLGAQGGGEVVERSSCFWLERHDPVIIKGFWNSLKTEENRDVLFGRCFLLGKTTNSTDIRWAAATAWQHLPAPGERQTGP